MATVTRTRGPLKAVHGTCRWLKPIGYDPECPDVGLVAINGRSYALGCGEGYYLLIAVEPDEQGQKGCYHLPLDLSSCDCPDATFRPERPGGCKHRRACAALGLKK